MAESTVPEGRRDRKKRETRARISGAATLLIQRRGFDNVTVAEVAEAADVSKMTVFNYFPRKEDLYLDRFPEREALLRDALAGCPPGEPPVAALRRLALRMIDERHPLSGVVDHVDLFLKPVDDSPALTARWREGADEAVAVTAAELARLTGRPAADPELRYIAAAVASIQDLLLRESARRSAAGERADAFRADIRALAVRLFDRLEGGIGADWGTTA